jgi:hypothetical protein
MSNPPPPYSNLTGISRTVMKDNAQATVVDYNGNARPAEFTVNINTNEIYIGNAAGDLTKVMQVNLYALYFDPATGEVVYYQP